MRRTGLPWAALLGALLAAVLAVWGSAVQAQQADDPGHPQDAPPLRISVLTFEPGPDYWQRFGHNALLVENTANGANAVYNYGMFDFAQKNFFLNFARGRMLYRLDADTLDNTLALYGGEGRWVRQQVLNFTPAQALQMARFLAHNAEPEQAQYYYDYFRDNCSTRVRDALDRVLGGALSQRLKAEATHTTYRHEATRLMRPIPFLAIGMDALLGPAADVPLDRWQQSFVPAVLMAALDEQQVDGQPLVQRTQLLMPDLGRYPAPAEPLHWQPAATTLGVTLALLLTVLGQSRRMPARIGFAVLATPVLLAMGLGGITLLAAWGLTDHWAMHANHNLLLFSPLALLFLRACWRAPIRREGLRQSHFMRGVLALMFLLALYALLPGPQTNTAWQALLLPAHLGLLLGLQRRL